MKILITGANGYLGARLFYDLRKEFDVVGTYNRDQFYTKFVQLDITNSHQVEQLMSKQKPDLIIHTANYPSPRQALDNQKNYIALNLESTQFLVDAANANNSKLIFISSFAALNPNNIYGELKLKSEELIKQTKTGYLIIRPSLILGLSPNTQNDRPFNRVLRCLDNKDTAEFDTSWEFQPTYIGHISEIISASIKIGIYNKTLHVSSASIQTQFSTAIDILKPFGVEVKPVDKGMKLPIQEVKDEELSSLGLPTCSYQKMIQNIHYEIKNRDKYKL